LDWRRDLTERRQGQNVKTAEDNFRKGQKSEEQPERDLCLKNQSTGNWKTNRRNLREQRNKWTEERENKVEKRNIGATRNKDAREQRYKGQKTPGISWGLWRTCGTTWRHVGGFGKQWENCGKLGDTFGISWEIGNIWETGGRMWEIWGELRNVGGSQQNFGGKQLHDCGGNIGA